jgi:hypothetical protein
MHHHPYCCKQQAALRLNVLSGQLLSQWQRHLW